MEGGCAQETLGDCGSGFCESDRGGRCVQNRLVKALVGLKEVYVTDVTFDESLFEVFGVDKVPIEVAMSSGLQWVVLWT